MMSWFRIIEWLFYMISSIIHCKKCKLLKPGCYYRCTLVLSRNKTTIDEIETILFFKDPSSWRILWIRVQNKELIMDVTDHRIPMKLIQKKNALAEHYPCTQIWCFYAIRHTKYLKGITFSSNEVIFKAAEALITPRRGRASYSLARDWQLRVTG